MPWFTWESLMGRAIINEALLDEYRACRTCWWCGKSVASCHVHHLTGRGMGGGLRFDVRENLAALCFACHGSHHDGNRPLTEDLLTVVAARLKTTQDALRDRLNCLRWGKHEDAQAGTRNGAAVRGDQRADVQPAVSRKPPGDRRAGVEATEDHGDGDWIAF